MLSVSFHGRKINIHFSFGMTLLILFLIFGNGILPCLFCCLLHECGHLLVCMVFRLQASELDFTASGLHLKVNRLQTLPVEKELLLQGGGILMNLLGAALFAVLEEQNLCWVSLALVFFHLIPAPELDGGRIWLLFGQRCIRAEWIFLHEWVGQGIAFIIFALFAYAALRYGETLFCCIAAWMAVSCILPGHSKSY